ncbi:MAG: 4Fe-4S dicluster domain-containing protein [Spirochaetaceae bacterium]
MSKSTVEVTLDGKKVRAERGSTVLTLCRSLGIEVPSLCEHSALPGFAGCRLCVVEQHRKGWKKLVTACEYPLMKDGDEFTTSSERIHKSRMMSAQLLLARAPEAKEVLEKAVGSKIEARFPELGVENSKCILCGLCYRYCYAQGTAAIYAVGRGADKAVHTPYGEANEACIGCGSCAAICPTEAIPMREPPGKRAIWRQLFELEPCPSCGTPHITGRMVDYFVRTTDLTEETLRLCPDCRTQKMSADMSTGLG